MLYKIDNTKFNPDKSLLQSNFTQPYIPQQTGSPQPHSKFIPNNPTAASYTQQNKNLATYNWYAGRGITNLRKAYHQKLKYSGGDDSLSLKLEIFYDFCAENGIT